MIFWKSFYGSHSCHARLITKGLFEVLNGFIRSDCPTDGIQISAGVFVVEVPVKHQMTQVLSLDFKKIHFYLIGIFLFNGPPLLTLKS